MSDAFGCIPATGRKDRNGYVFDGDKLAHVVAWERARGAVPDGMFVLHMCANRSCRALHHLEVGTKSENERQKRWSHLINRVKCPRGHDWRPNIVRTQFEFNGKTVVGAVCRQCNREACDVIAM